MNDALLFLTLVTGSIGFILWYTISSSLRLPVRYQIMYDANPPYVNRVVRRRIYTGVIFAVIPLIIIFCTHLIERPSWQDLNISFAWNQLAWYAIVAVAIAIPILYITTRSHANLEQYPEIRVRFWRPRILFWSAFTWILHVLATEFFYRGLLFQSLLFKLELWHAIAVCAAFYSLTHYFRRNRMTMAGILWGVFSCWLTDHAGSLMPSIIIHLGFCLFVEWFSLKHHMEMYVRKT
jgi:membrane protease YdiL (CAAX protease family)